MPDRHWIEELPQHAGQTVSVRGWVTTTRSSGKIAFVVVRDGTGLLQAVLSKKDLPADVWDAFGKLTQETSVEVTGVVRAEPRAPGGVELQTSDLKILGARAEDLQVGRLQLDAARGARLGAHHARHLDRRLLSKFPERIPDVRGQVFLGENRL